MLSSYKVLPMTADDDICALIDPKGDQVAMGSREVCQTLLFLVTNSSLIERPPQYFEQSAPGRHPGRSVEPEAAREVVSAPPSPGSRTYSSQSSGGPPEALSEVSANRASAERKLVTSHPGARLREPGFQLGAAASSVFGDTYFSGPPASMHWYVGLYIVLLICSALLTWALFLKL